MIDIIRDFPIVPVFYDDDIEKCKDVLASCYKGGVRLFEFVDRGEQAEHNFRELRAFRNEYFPKMKLGIGTIKTVSKAEQYINMEADFLVSPLFNQEIAKLAQKRNIFWIPGCMTPTEVGLAEEAGCELIKIFPGNVVGPGFVKGVRAVFPDLCFMPTGGVELNRANLEPWFLAGVVGVGIGSSLFSNIHSEHKDSVQENLINAFKLITDIKKNI